MLDTANDSVLLSLGLVCPSITLRVVDVSFILII